MNVSFLFLGGGPLDGLVGVAKGSDGSWPAVVRGDHKVAYELQMVAVPPGAVGTADGHRIRNGQLVYCRSGHEPRFETMTRQEITGV